MVGTWTCIVVAVAAAAPDALTLPDLDGRPRMIAAVGDDRYLVVAFLGVDCPLAKLYAGRLNELAADYRASGVRFVAVDPHPGDGLPAMRAFADEHHLKYPFVRDAEQATVERLAATRTPEIVVLDRNGAIRYRGRIDDQYLVGVHRTAPTTPDLRRALDELLAGRLVSVPATEPVGCRITRLRPTSTAAINYADHVAPIIEARCAGCHRPGRVAPFSLLNYQDVAAHSAMIDEVVAADRMPPWHADGEHGRFANDPRLTVEQKQTIRQWIAEGCRSGDLALLPATTIAVDHNGWTLGRPDAVFAIPEPFLVPAQGIVDYQYFVVDPGFAEDRWVSALEVKPGNRAVVHHCNVYLQPPGSNDAAEFGSLGSTCLAAMAAGTPATILPPGMAKRIPAGWKLKFVVHYVAVGAEQWDRTSLGLQFADAGCVTHEVATRLLVDEQLCIPPYAADHRVAHAERFERDVLLLAMFPHLHLRGKSFRYEAEYPDGRRETLLNVPRWDFHWQHRYEFAEPKRLPAGTVLHCVATYDNSASNPANPDPTATVQTGPRSEDEMFNAYYDVALAEPEYPTRRGPPKFAAPAVCLLLLAVAVWQRKVRRVRSSDVVTRLP